MVKAKGSKEIEKKNVKLEKLVIEYINIDAIKPNEYNPNRQSEHDFNLLKMSMSEDGFCVETTTPILCADLVWRPAGELEVGQEIVAFDEERDEAANTKHGRRFRTAKVTGNNLFEDELYEVRTEIGDVVRCNAQHPWLTRRTHGPVDNRVRGTWVETKDLEPGDQVVKLFDPWEVEDTYEAGWLAGFLDGEGCVAEEKVHDGNSPAIVRLSVSQKPGEIAERMEAAIAARANKSTSHVWEHSKKTPERNWQDNVRVRVSNMADIMRVLGSVRPQRLLDNAGAFWEGRSIATKNSGCHVASVTKVGRGALAALSTSTKTYIASGFAVHNTQPIIVQRKDNTIVDGEHRWRAARELGWDSIPIVYVDMTPEQMRIATLRHNRARGEEDIELTAQVLRDLQQLGALDWAQDSLAMSDDEINRMIEDIDVPEALAGEEFGEAWEPGAKTTVEENESTEGQKDKAIEGTITSAMTTEAIDARRKREKDIEAAKTEEEKEKIRQDNKIHRLNLVFSGDEAELVEEVLGRYPAEALVKMCRYWHDNELGGKLEAAEAPPESPASA